MFCGIKKSCNFKICFRLVELGKSELKTKAKDKRDYAKNTMFRKTKNRSGVTETRIISCAECGEEYCNGESIFRPKDVRFKSFVTSKP